LVQILLSGTFADAHRALVNQGALPAGVDGKTFDGMSLEKLAAIARRVADGSWNRVAGFLLGRQ